MDIYSSLFKHFNDEVKKHMESSMTKFLFFSTFLTFAGAAHAHNSYSLLNLDPYAVVAPAFSGTPVTPVVGQIYFDLSAGGFRGINKGGGVDVFSSINTSPTVTIKTGSCSYSPPAGVVYLRVKMVGGGGGGSGSTASSSGSGGTTQLGTSLIANGGAGGSTTAAVAGGSVTLTTGATVFQVAAVPGQSGPAGQNLGSATGGTGGNSPLGGAGAGGYFATVGNAAAANSGSGGGGGGSPSGVTASNGGGGAGGYVEALITSPSTYTFSPCTVGSGGSAGAGTPVGGAGGSGVMIIEEYDH